MNGFQVPDRIAMNQARIHLLPAIGDRLLAAVRPESSEYLS